MLITYDRILLNLFLHLFLILLVTYETKAEGVIEGIFHLDSSWARKVYLSHINSFNNLYRMSNDMIIAETPLDNSGNFSFKTNYFPKEDNLYRIHISKKSDPRASLIIGGDDENHFFLIANNTSYISLKNAEEKAFKQIDLYGFGPNCSLKKIDEIASYVDSTILNHSIIKKEFAAKAVYEKLRYCADTSKHPLVSLYAMYKSKYESNYPKNRNFYFNYLNKWKGENSTYFKTFRSHFPNQIDKGSVNYIFVGICCFVLGLLTNSILRKIKNRNPALISSLSVQERKIFNLIQLGMSNKEISDECSIGLNTVKTHVYNIYSKLDIKSRKEAINYKTK